MIDPNDEAVPQLPENLVYEDFSREEKLAMLAESGLRAGWDSPEMDEYDEPGRFPPKTTD